MKPVVANRFVLYGLIVGAGLFGDLYSKEVVFDDLGYPGGMARPAVEGRHEVFAGAEGREGESVQYIQGWTTFRLLTSFNRGALWGLGQGYWWIFSALSVLAVAGILYWLFVYGAAESRWLTIALALITSGTLGNLYDRLALHGYADPFAEDGGSLHAVRDFLLFTFGSFHWPVFNFADVFLVTGAVMLLLQSFFHRDAETAGPDIARLASEPPAKTAG